MKKTLITLLFAFALCFNLNAQCIKKHFKIVAQKITKLEPETIVKEVGEIDNKLYTLFLTGKSDFFLKVVDTSEKKTFLKIPILFSQKNGENIEFEDVIIIQNKLYVLENVFSELNNTHSLVSIELSKEGHLIKNKGLSY